MKKYKDGIYEGDYGVTYFIQDDRVLLKHLGKVYKSTNHFVFGNWRQELQPKMINQFDEVYNKSEKW